MKCVIAVRTGAAYAALICISVFCRPAIDARAAENVLAEFSFDQYLGMAAVPVVFSGGSYTFKIETANEYTSFDSKLASLLAKTHATAKVMTSQGIVTMDAYQSPEGRLGDLMIPSMEPVWCRDHQSERNTITRIDGCLGMDAIRRFVVQFDYDYGKVRFLRFAPRDAGARLALVPAIGSPVVRGNVGGRALTFRIATGNLSYGAGGLGTHDFKELSLSSQLTFIGEILTLSVHAPAIHRAYAVSAAVSIGGFRHEGLVFSDYANAPRDEGILGVGYLRRYLVTFDFPNHAVFLKPSRQFRQIDGTQDPGGLRLCRDAELVVVTAARGLAQRAGVRALDVLETANDTPVAGLDDTQIARLLVRRDRPVVLALRRPSDGRVLRFTYDVQAERERMLKELGVNEPPAATGAVPAIGRRRILTPLGRSK